MSKREVSVAVKAEFAKVFVDGKRIVLDNGVGATAVTKGNEHALTWAVRGAPGTKYIVAIKGPKEATLEHGETFGAEGFDAGIAWFRVSEGQV